jgi:hypothetical protein
MTERSDLTAALQALATQQAALVEAQTEALRLQRVLVEHLLNNPVDPSVGNDANGSASAVSAHSSPTAGRSESDGTLPTGATSQDPSAPGLPMLLRAHGGDPAPELTGPHPPSQLAPPRDAASVTPGTKRARGSRYFQPHPTRPAKMVTQHDLVLMRGLVDVGAAGRLVLQFGPHRGATLGQVARMDPTYVRSLALKAQRPNVRAAALRLVSVLEDVENNVKVSRKQSPRSRK